MWDELENALAWYAAAPVRWVDSARQDLSAAAEWIWIVLQGDFADEQSTAQIVTGTVISMIPLVDQICDVRDLAANCKKINADSSNTWAWVALLLTLVGLIPLLGSLAKGCCKILFAYGRKFAAKSDKAVKMEQFWEASRSYVDAGILKLNQHLQSPVVRRTLNSLNILEPYRWLADEVRRLAAALDVGELLKVFDQLIDSLRELIELIQRWSDAAMATRAGQMLETVLNVRRMAHAKLEECIRPVHDWMEKLARRLDIEADMSHRARVGAVNVHPNTPALQAANDAIELDLNKPGWVDKTERLVHKAMEEAPSKSGWPDISASGPDPLKDLYKTFKDATPVPIPPGEKLYRVVAPGSNDNAGHWMREAEFLALKNRDDWRRRFAVWRYWNRNGEYVTYTVPPGQSLKAWEGPAASQQLRKDSLYVLEGGAMQIVVDPRELQPVYLSKRQPTNWGYRDFPGESDEFLGLPKLTNKIDRRYLPPDHKLDLPE
ncbi:hypothetical protein GQA94_12960 [Stutzerimonas stutzeri]|uniref:Uncharacterized protein n=1 Tax=Stutzerimonas stutzeri TaxID=316 RepID=A0A6I6LKH1_STUST|nr:hypothetical protein GQA94_12960 [Stutzerimonas stutzeri]